MNIHCPHFHRCSGCHYNASVDNIQTVFEAKKFFSDLQVLYFALHTGNACHWRCRAKLAVRGVAGQPLIGLFEENSHSVVSIPQCKVHHPLINQAVEIVRVWMIKENITSYQEATGYGFVRYLQLAVDRNSQKVQLSLVLNIAPQAFRSSNFKAGALSTLWEAGRDLWHSLWVNFNQRRDNIILGTEWENVRGELWLWEQLCGREICFHPGSFAQANPAMFKRLLVSLKQQVPHGTKLVEFYAGGGVIGLTLVDICEKIVCNEIAPLAEVCFNESLTRLPVDLKNKISFVLGPAASHANLLLEADVVIIDPPRKGADRLLLEKINQTSHLKRLIYVSCGWKSFQKDALYLLKEDWKLIQAEGFLFFPGSEHLEILAVFDRN